MSKGKEIFEAEKKAVKTKLMAVIKKQFKKESDNQLFFTDAELLEIYADVLKQLAKPVEGNVNGVTYLSSLISE